MPVRRDAEVLNAQLQRFLKFTPEDLYTNQRGEMTRRQYDGLMRTRGCYRMFGCLFAAMAVPGALILIAAAGGVTLIFGASGALLPLGGVGLLFLLAGLYVLWAALRTQHPRWLSVQEVRGTAKVRIDAASDSVFDGRVIVAGKTFKMPSMSARLFKQGRQFRIYYVQNGVIPMLLSAEVLEV